MPDPRDDERDAVARDPAAVPEAAATEPAMPAEPGPTATATPSLGRSSVLLASGTIVSRVLGFVSVAVLTWAIGLNNPSANAFSIANTLPNNILLLIAGGFLSAVLVPQIVKAGLHADGGERFVNRIVTLGVVVFLGVTLLATLGAPLLVGVYTLSQTGDEALAGDGVALAVVFAYWCLPQIFFYALYSLLSEVLNARGVFGPYAWAPVANNVVAIGGLLVFAALFGVDPAHADPAGWSTAEVAVLAGGATLGVVSQAVILMLFWRRAGLRYRPDFRWRGVGLGETGRVAGWAFGMIVVNQLAGIVQVNLAGLAGPDDPAVNALRITWAIFVLPHSLITVSIATPYFTRMSGHVRDGDLGAVRADLSASLRTVVLLTVGAAAALAAASVPFLRVFANSAAEAAETAPVLGAYLIGLASFSALYLVHRGFYALGDTRTPFLIQCLQAVLFVALAVPAAIAAPDAGVAAGIAAVISVAGAVQATVAALVLRRRLGGRGGGRVLRRFGGYALATIPAAAAGIAVLVLLGGVSLDGGLPVAGSGFALGSEAAAIVSVAAIGATTMLVYVGVLALFRVPELAALTGVARRLLRRGRPDR